MFIYGILRNLINVGFVIIEKYCFQFVGENNNFIGNERGKLFSFMEYYFLVFFVVQG